MAKRKASSGPEPEPYDLAEAICAICNQPLFQDLVEKQKKENLNKKEVQNYKPCVAECGHCFHKGCIIDKIKSAKKGNRGPCPVPKCTKIISIWGKNLYPLFFDVDEEDGLDESDSADDDDNEMENE